MSLKRKRTDLSLADKYEAVKLLKKNVPQTEIAKRLGCSQPQISTISKNRDAIQAEYEGCSNPERKRQRSGKAPTVESALTEWFTAARSRDIPISSNILQEKAVDLASQMNINDFNATSGWLSRWKQRNNIGFKKMHGEKKDADQEAVNHWIDNILPNLLETYSPDNIFNADETGIYYRALPDGTLTFKTDAIAGSKKAKDRVTAMVCVNVSGSDKQRLLVIRKSRDPRCFRGKKSLPVVYRSSANAWMTSDIFREWLKDFNKQMVRQNRKVLLLVDNCSAHPKDAADRLSNVKLEFLPANTTSVIQPCDQGIIKNLKTLYRSQVETVAEEEEEIDIPEGFNREEFLNYVDSDTDLACHRLPTDEDICAQFMNEEKSRDLEIDSEEEDEIQLPVSSSEAKDALSVLRRYLEDNGCEDFNDLYSLEEKCDSLATRLKKQKKITEFINWIP
ncbi:tigger transposable element-derived protein 6-like [Ostrea edulis]|uniref:tigger transposable element-derived protein 6-like n=1 Tax=Ostrea edulis TaxID=37623 RepID=UPI0024AF6D15|nr:tigger transposable element-derived protein 6-like [Ostrea edulis]